MATNRDFVVKNGLVVTEDIELGHATDTTIARASAGAITVEGTAVILAGDSPTFGTVTIGTDLIHDGDTNNKIAFGTDTQSFQTGGTARFNISDSGLQIGSGARVTEIEDNDSLGTSDTKLATQGNVKAYVDANAGGASAIGDLSDAITTATSNIGLGSAALDSLTASSGNYNVALGINAGTAVTTGDNNVAIGFDALKTASTQSEATAVGYKAAEDLAGGVFGSTFIGVRAGSNVTTGWGNTGLGHDALNSENGAGTGSSNVAVGYQAMRGATSSTAVSGSQNVAVGGNAMEDITSGAYNIAVGYQALTNLNSGANNTAVGHRAGDAVTTGTDNTLIGKDAGGALSTGEDNVVIGNEAGLALTGSDAVIIGDWAGKSQTQGGNVLVGSLAGYNANSTWGNNVAIGNQAAMNLHGTGSIYIGYNAAGSGTHNAAHRNIGIGDSVLNALTEGDQNIAIGYGAGDNITTGSNNVIIGKIDAPSATGDDQLVIASGDGTPTWITGDANGLVAHKISVVAVTGSTTLTDAQSGSYVYCTSSGAPTLPATAEIGQQYTIINNTGSDLTPGLGTSNSTVPSSHTAISDDKARTYVAVAVNTWFFVG